MAATGTDTARGLLRPSPATAMVTGTAMAATGTATARGLLRPSPATAMVTGTAMAATGTATARGLLRPSPATATDEATVMAMGTATMVEVVHIHAHVLGSATVRGLPSLSQALEPSTSPTPKKRFCDQLRIFNYV